MNQTDLKQMQAAIAKLQGEGRLPRTLSAAQTAQLQKALAKYSGQVSEKVVAAILADFKNKIQSAASMTDPAEARGVIADLTEFVGSPAIADRIRFALKISAQVSAGAGQYLNQNLTPAAVDNYPALALQRLMSRMVPRGLKIAHTAKGVPQLEDDSENNWPTRWQAAGEACGDDDWLPWEGDDQTGRGVALKSSGIWQALGDGAGGYEDTLGNPFAPFAFNSGFSTVNISRAEAVSLGLLDEGEPVQPAKIDFQNLFAEVAA